MDQKYIVVGTGNLAVKIAQYLCEQKKDVAVYEKRLAHSFTAGESCAAKQLAYKQLTPDEMTAQLLSDLETGPLTVISAINTYIFPRAVIEHPNFYGINYHNALLPAHRGMNAEAWAIFQMDSDSGITWHRIIEQVDKGEIICQKKIALPASITSMKLLRIQRDFAFQSFLEFAPQLLDGSLATYPQSAEPGEFHWIHAVPNDGYLDLSWSMEKISAFLRAMDYGALYTLGKPKIKLDDTYIHTYACGRYRIIQNNFPAEQDELVIQDNTITIMKKGSSQSVILFDLEELPTG